MSSATPSPSWADFCEQIAEAWPEATPDQKDTKWTNLYTVYGLGYGACLIHMKQLLEQENDPSSPSATP